jgi:NAD(P)-dependent dehydrogenase (short-subunit alcohol dehydrogenase family)
MLLVGKTAVVYGAAGSVGSAVARAFAREGASVVLAGRTQAALEVVAAAIRQAGGTAAVSAVDARDETSINRHVDQVVETTGRLDISFNAIAVDHVQGFRWLTSVRRRSSVRLPAEWPPIYSPPVPPAATWLPNTAA